MIEIAPHFSNVEMTEQFLTLSENKELWSFVRSINEEYLYWNKVKYKKSPDGCTPEKLWMRVKLDRLLQTNDIHEWQKYMIHFGLTNRMQSLCHEFDMNFGGVLGNDSLLQSEDKHKYLVSSLMEEAIASSQMEGASTTRKVAKEMLRKGLKPRDKAQQMILNNYNTIRYISEHKDQSLTEEALLHIHSLMTENTLDNPEDCGQFRGNDDVVVVDDTKNEVVHTPPSHTEIQSFVKIFCDYFNAKEDELFVHPIIKGIILHFMIAYMHPFVDGNGRTARAIFYWYMLKEGYWLMEYMSISRIIYKRKNDYEKAYLYAEADGNDIGYFILYHLKVLKESFEELQVYLQRKSAERNDVDKFLRIGGINQRQAEILRLYVENPSKTYFVKDFQVHFGITATTAKTDIVGLMDKGFLREIQINEVKKGYIKSEDFNEILSNFL